MLNDFDDCAGEYGEWDCEDLAACDELLGPAELVDEDDWLDCDEEDE